MRSPFMPHMRSVSRRPRTSHARRVVLESLEGRELLTSLSISDATAVEGSRALKLIDRFITVPSGTPVNDVRRPIFGPDGNHDGIEDLYVATIQTNSVLRYDGVTGSFIDTFVAPGSGGLNGPTDLAFGPDGKLYVSSNPGGQVLRYDGNTGAFLDVIASSTVAKSFNGLTFGPDGNLYLVNQPANEVLRYNDASGLSTFIGAGSGGLAWPRKVVFGPDGNGDNVQDMYVASQNTGDIRRFDSLTGGFIDVFATTPPGTTGIMGWLQFGTDGYLYAATRLTSGSLDATIVRYDANTGAFLDSLPLGRDGWAFTIGPENVLYYSSNSAGTFVDRFGASSFAVFSVSLDAASAAPVTVDYSTAAGSAAAGADYVTISGSLTFAPGQTTRTILVPTTDDATSETTETFTVSLSNPVGATITDGQGVATILDNETKFFIVDDATSNRTFEYGSGGASVESYALSRGNTAPRGAASTAAGDKVWVVDSNKKVYVYNTSGGLLGSWTTGSLASNATVEGIATNGTDVWIVDAQQDKVFQFTGAASRLSGSQNAASSFSLNNGNTGPKDLVTDGASLWVVNDASTDKVFKYSLTGSLQGSWTITGAGTSPTGITLDPSGGGTLWIVDNGSERVYQFDNSRSRTSGSQSPSTSFALASGNTNPQGIADPPMGSSPAVPTPSRKDPLEAYRPVVVDVRAAQRMDLIVLPPAEERAPFAIQTPEGPLALGSRFITRRRRS